MHVLGNEVLVHRSCEEFTHEKNVIITLFLELIAAKENQIQMCIDVASRCHPRTLDMFQE